MTDESQQVPVDPPGDGVRQAPGPVDEHGVRRQLLPSIVFRFLILAVFLGIVGWLVRSDRSEPLPFDLDTSLDGLQVEVVASGLTLPVAASVAANGEVFIAEKSGVVKYLDSLQPGEPSVLVDFSPEVHELGDRGLMGIAAHPEYPAKPYVYALYTRDAPPGGEAATYRDICPDLGQVETGCVVGARLVEIEVGPGGVFVGQRTLLEDQWCQIFVAHGVADLAFGPDGKLYVASGDGASYNFPDDGKHDLEYPSLIGGGCAEEDDERGAFRAQDALNDSDPLTYNGAVIRIDVDAGRIEPELVAFGLRNPFGLTFREGTNEMWVVDVGWTEFEEINIVQDVNDAPMNFGWPCREGPAPATGYADDDQCVAAEADPSVSFEEAFLAWPRLDAFAGCDAPVVAFTDMAFVPEAWGDGLAGGALVADWGSACVAFLEPDASGMPDPTKVRTVISNTTVVDLDELPDGRIAMLNIGADFAEGYLVLLSKK